MARQHCTAASFMPDGSCCAGYADGHVRLLSTAPPPSVCWTSKPHPAEVISVGPSADGALLLAGFRYAMRCPVVPRACRRLAVCMMHDSGGQAGLRCCMLGSELICSTCRGHGGHPFGTRIFLRSALPARVDPTLPCSRCLMYGLQAAPQSQDLGWLLRRDGTVAAMQAATGGALVVSDQLRRGLSPLDSLVIRPWGQPLLAAAAWQDQLCIVSIGVSIKETALQVVASHQVRCACCREMQVIAEGKPKA